MDVIMPQLGETVAEGTVTRWYKKVGDAVKADETLFDVETDKVSTEIPAPVAGVITEILVEAGVTAKVGTRIAVIRAAGEAATAAPAAAATPAPAAAAPAAGRPALAPRDAGLKLSPVVRRLLAQHELDPRAIRGSGRDGRLTREDVVKHVEAARAAPPVSAPPVAPPAAAPRPATAAAPASIGEGDRIVPLNAIRSRTATHMVNAWTTAPHVLQAVEVDYHRIDRTRAKVGADWIAREGFELTYLPFIARAVSIALAKFPNLNASFDGDRLVVRRRINIGIAVDLNLDGLIVPVVKDVPSKSLAQIARDIRDVAVRARQNRLKPDDLAGGTYTLSNSGVFGTLITAPIINQPQVAILSTDGVKKRPVVIEGPEGDTIAIRPVGVLAQTFDHRAVDGAYSASFLKEVRSVLETRDWLQDLQA